MNRDEQLKVQAFLDGELPEKEAREIFALLARDEEVNALAKELRNTRQALKSSEVNVRVPESREFYWSKIQRAIDQLEPAPAPVKSVSWFQVLRRVLIPTGALALLALIGMIMSGQTGFGKRVAGPDNEMVVADSGAFTYHDFAHGTTLVWVSYPAER